MTERIRVNMHIGSTLRNWYVEQAELMGVPYTSYMIMALNEFMKQTIAVQDIDKVAKEVREIKSIVMHE